MCQQWLLPELRDVHAVARRARFDTALALLIDGDPAGIAQHSQDLPHPAIGHSGFGSERWHGWVNARPVIVGTISQGEHEQPLRALAGEAIPYQTGHAHAHGQASVTIQTIAVRPLLVARRR